MRFQDLRKITALLEAVERGERPDKKTVREAREAADRERAILVRRVDQQHENLNRWKLEI